MSAGAEQQSRGPAEVFQVMRRASAFGEATSENGARMYGHVTRVAPEAWFHIVYPSLDDQEIVA